MYTNADLKICQYLLIHIKWISWTLILRILELFIYKVCILEGGLTLKRVRHKIRTYIQMHRTNKYSQHSSIIVASLAKWLSVCLWFKWLWVQIQLQSYMLFLSKEYKNRRVVSSLKAFCFIFKTFNETFWNVIFVRHLKMKRFKTSSDLRFTRSLSSCSRFHMF